MYVMLGMQPNILYTVTTLSMFSSNPGTAHWDTVKRVYHDLIGTWELWLLFGSIGKELIGYTDVDGSKSKDRHTLSGYIFLVDGRTASWSMKRQEIMSLLMTESEYMVVTHAMKEALWLRLLIGQVFEPLTDVTTLFSDNQSTIALTKDHQYHACLKHIDVHFHLALPSPKVKHFTTKLSLHTV